VRNLTFKLVFLLQFDDMRNAPVDGEDFDKRWTPFIAWHEYLVEQFPLV